MKQQSIVSNPMVSVIVPTYKREKTLKTCIDSILSSEYENLEIIIVNDGSTDGTYNLCQNFAIKDSRIHVINQLNSGLSAARNAGIRLTKGEWISFIDDDDAVHPSFYKEMIASADESTDLIMVGRGLGKIEDAVVRLASVDKNVIRRQIRGNKNVVDFLFGELDPYRNPIYFVTDKLFRRQTIIGNNIWFREDVSLAEDQIFVLDYLRYVDSLLYDSFPFYLSIQWNGKVRGYSMGQDLRSPEYFWMIQKANYAAFERLLSYCPNHHLRSYAVNYIVDRPITRILYNYTRLRNLSKYSFFRLRSFMGNEIIPFFRTEIRIVEGIKDKKVRYYYNALLSYPFAIVYLQLLMMTNMPVLWTLAKSWIRRQIKITYRILYKF